MQHFDKVKGLLGKFSFKEYSPQDGLKKDRHQLLMLNAVVITISEPNDLRHRNRAEYSSQRNILIT